MANTADTTAAGKIVEVTFTGSGADWNHSTDGGFADMMHVKSIIWHPSGADDILVVNEGGVDGPSIVHWKAYADLVANGSFTVDKDPPDDWTAAAGTTLTTEGSGQSGNCMKVLDGNSSGVGTAYQQQATVVGKSYQPTIYFKLGNASYGLIRIGPSISDDIYYASGNITDATWTKYMATFMATTTTTYITLLSVGADDYCYFDEVVLDELPLNKQIDFGEKGVPLKPYIDISDCTFSDITATKIIFILE